MVNISPAFSNIYSSASVSRSVEPEEKMPIKSSPLGPITDDILCTSGILTSGILYKAGVAQARTFMADNPPLRDVAPVSIERPYIMVPGWTTKPDKFDDLVNKLTEGGRNGGHAYYVQNGEFFADGALTQKVEHPPADAKVFVAVFENSHQDPSTTAPQLSKNLTAIRQATGSEKVDIEGYSMGGLCTRQYLDQEGQGVGKVMLLGTPNHGTRFAQLATRVIKRDIKFALKLAGVAPIDLPAMDWLSAGHDNGHLQQLNSRFEQQKAKAESLVIVGSDALPTPGSTKVPLRQGDGMVAANSLQMPDTNNVLLTGRPTLHHGSLPSDSGVYQQRAEFFGWKQG